MEDMIHVFMTHYARPGSAKLTDVTVDAAVEIERVSADTPHTLTVVGWTETDALWEALEKKLPSGVKAIRNDRPGRSDIQPSQRNKVVDVARALGDTPFVLVHNDVRPAYGWLDRLTEDLRAAETRWGIGSSAVAPRQIPFHRLPKGSPVWDTLRPPAMLHNPLLGFFPPVPDDLMHNDQQLLEWCTKNGGYKMLDGLVYCPDWAPPTNDGRALMMFVTRPSFFDDVGECDEAFVGSNYDDYDWAIRALQAGKQLLTSQTALLGHLQQVSFKTGKALGGNDQVFINKWGAGVFAEMTSGRIWANVHRDTWSQ